MIASFTAACPDETSHQRALVMKRSRGVKDTLKKKVRFEESQNEIFQIDDTSPMDEELPSGSQSTRPYRSGNNETEWLEDIKEGEEAYVHSGDNDIPLEPFNLEEERRFGTFEDDGFYVENKTEKAEASDAWLSSDAAVCSIAVLRKHEARQKALMEAEQAPKMSLSETMELKRKIVDCLMPRETVLMGLRRLAGQTREKSGDAKRKTEGDMRAFEDLTEWADALLNAGEIDAYSMYREEFQNLIESFTPANRLPDEADGGASLCHLVPDVVSLDDMFAEDSDEEGEGKKQNDGKEAKDGDKVDSASVPCARPSDKPPMDEVDFSEWPISELKRFLVERGIDCSLIVEKSDLVKHVQEASTKSLHSVPYRAPDGFVYHPEIGYFYNEEKGLYYDGSSRCFYDPKTVEWYDANWNKLKTG